jgi:hypothetical protein
MGWDLVGWGGGGWVGGRGAADLPAGGAGGDEGKGLVLGAEALRGALEQAGAGGAEGVPDGQRPPARVDDGHVGEAHALAPAQRLPAELVRVEGLEVGQDLPEDIYIYNIYIIYYIYII